MALNVQEQARGSVPGGIVVLGVFVHLALAALLTAAGWPDPGLVPFVAWGTLPFSLFLLFGLFTVNPNEARVVQLFGAYQGTVREPGLRWVNPLCSCHAVSTRVRNFDSDRLKVNDLEGNPIEIGAVVVWQVVDTAEATFVVDDFVHYVKVQSEAALRDMATHYAYDAHNAGEISLRGDTAHVATQLQAQVQERLGQAGVQVLEARISHLAYAPEIASAMLQRQQASAIIAARSRIVEGAVGMVRLALDQLAEHEVVALDGEAKAALVSNLLLVLCSDRHVQPVLGTGS
jgi:regulator of protease activity HflC (stomatin/prohibitin superfamily)